MVRKNEANRCTSAGIGSNATPSVEVNSSGWWLAKWMSSRRVNAQNPGSEISKRVGSGRCQLRPSSARNCANVWSRISKG